jgi:serine/threonine protein kinase
MEPREEQKKKKKKKRARPEGDEEPEKRKRGRPSTGVTPEERKSGKHAKREKRTERETKRKAKQDALMQASAAAKEIALKTGYREFVDHAVEFMTFNVAGFMFEFAFKWTWLDKKDPDLAAKLAEAKEKGSTAHLAIPKYIVRVPYIRNKVVIEIYKKYKETLEEKMKREKRLPLGESKMYYAGILEGIASLHSVDILHNDLKPDNIVLTLSNTLKLIDYGNIIEGAKNKSTSSGNKYYDAAFYMPKYAHEVFAATSIFVEMLTGRRARCEKKKDEDTEITAALESVKKELGEGEGYKMVEEIMTFKTIKRADEWLKAPFFGGSKVHAAKRPKGLIGKNG